MRVVREEDIRITTPVTQMHLARSGEWFMHMYPEVEATEERIEQASRYFRESFLERPDSTFWGVDVLGEHVGIIGLLEQNPISETAVIFGIGDRPHIEKECAGLGRLMVKWMTSAMVPDSYRVIRAYCRETMIFNMMAKAGFEEIDLNDRAMAFKG